MLSANLGLVIGPILSPHQARINWQGNVARIVSGVPLRGDPIPNMPAFATAPPWDPVDVRDVAEAEVRLAESADLPSGGKYIVSSADHIPSREVGVDINELFPEYDAGLGLSTKDGNPAVVD